MPSSWLRRRWGLMLLSVVVAAPRFWGPADVIAQGVQVDPLAIAISPEDLPAGFSPSTQQIGGAAPSIPFATTHTVSLERDKSEEALQSWPVAITQVIFRIDRLIVPKDFFSQVADEVVREQQFEVLANPDTSGESVRLYKQELRGDAEIALFGIGMVKDNFIWFTFVAGVTPVTTMDVTLAINNISITKYDRLRVAAESLPPLITTDQLLGTLVKSEELPMGLLADPPQPADLSERSGRNHALGEIDVRTHGYSDETQITFIVYPSIENARASFAQAPGIARDRGASITTPPNLTVALFCASRGGTLEDNVVGATSCLAQVGNIEVSGFSLVDNADSGDMEHALQLTLAGVEHLGRLK